MIMCPNCGFKFILVYPLGQRLCDGYHTNAVTCPVCREVTGGFPANAQGGSFNRLVVVE